jgi:rare lipoprotein A
VRPLLVLAVLALAPLAGCAHRATPGFHPPLGPTQATEGPTPRPLAEGADAPDNTAQVGLATWYGSELAGHKTASGELFDPSKMTAAHRKLRFGTWVEVRRIDTGRTVRVRITDRGPNGDERRIIDLSREAAERLDILTAGRARVEVRIVHGPE